MTAVTIEKLKTATYDEAIEIFRSLIDDDKQAPPREDWFAWIRVYRGRWKCLGRFRTKAEAEAAKEQEAKRHQHYSSFITDSPEEPT